MAILTDDKFQNYDPFNPEPRLEEGRTPTPIRRYVSFTTQTLDPINMYFIKRGRENDNFNAISEGMNGSFEYQNQDTYRNRFLPSQILNEERGNQNPEFVRVHREMGQPNEENYLPPVYRWSYAGTELPIQQRLERPDPVSLPLSPDETLILRDTLAGNPPVFAPGDPYLLSIDTETGLSPRNSPPPYGPNNIGPFNLLDELDSLIPSLEEIRSVLGEDINDRVQGFDPKPGFDPGGTQPTAEDPFVLTSGGESFRDSIRASGIEDFLQITSENGVILPAQVRQDGKILPATIGNLIFAYTQVTDPSLTMNRVALINALTAYYETIQRMAPFDIYQDFSFHNFKEEAPYLVDYISYWALNGITSAGISNNIQYQFMRGAASVRPNYNYNSIEYEEAIKSVPEAALPNLYMYSFVSERDGGLPPPWQNESTELKQLQGDYDKIIKVGEFVKGTLPLLQMNDEGFRNYLENYAQATKDSILDFSSPQAQEYYDTRDRNRNLVSPASEMGFYDRLNQRKSMFPMYIEMNLPTSPIGDLGTIIESTRTSTSYINSIARTSVEDSNTRTMNVFTSGINLISGRPDPYEFYSRDPGQDEPRVDAQIDHEGLSMDLSFVDIEEWLDAASEDMEDVVVLSEQGQERLQGQCAGLRERLQFRAVENYINSQKNINLIKYEDVITCVNHDDNSPAYCRSETIAYKVIKHKIVGDGKVPVQNFYFPNTSKENVIKFVDTQVKRLGEGGRRQEYVYEVYGYAVVYGSTFRIRPDLSNIQLDYVPINPEPGFDLDAAPVYFQYSVETIASPKIVEYPIFADQFRRTGLYGVRTDSMYINHRPPSPPDLSIHPYKENYRQVLMNIQPHSGEEFIGQNAIKYIKLSDADFDGINGFRDEAIYQIQHLNYSLKFPFLEFKSEGGLDIGRVEVYRTQDIPIEPSSVQELYNAFGTTPHKVLDTRRRKRDSEGNIVDVPPSERANAFDFVDNLEPNQKYYYTCRSSDMDEKKSNPGPIYEVELQYYEGVYNPVINLYEPPIIPPRKRDKRFVRFVEIKAADIQTYVRNFVNPQTEVLSSEIGLVPDDVHDQKFIVRITSKDTGKKMDIKLSFKKDAPN